MKKLLLILFFVLANRVNAAWFSSNLFTDKSSVWLKPAFGFALCGLSINAYMSSRQINQTNQEKYSAYSKARTRIAIPNLLNSIKRNIDQLKNDEILKPQNSEEIALSNLMVEDYNSYPDTQTAQKIINNYHYNEHKAKSFKYASIGLFGLGSYLIYKSLK